MSIILYRKWKKIKGHTRSKRSPADGKGTEEVAPHEGPLVKYMTGKFGPESVARSADWSEHLGGSMSKNQLDLLRKRMTEKEKQLLGKWEI